MVNDSVRVLAGWLPGYQGAVFIQLCKNALWSSQAEIRFLKRFFFSPHVLNSVSLMEEEKKVDGMAMAAGFKERQMGMRNGPSSPVLS